MAFKLEDVLSGEGLLTTAAVVIGGYFLMPLISQIARPVAKAGIKAGMQVYDWDTEMAAETAGLAAEAKAEMTPAAISDAGDGATKPTPKPGPKAHPSP